jgi:hypothetical protein
MKTCSKCKASKELVCFGKNKSRSDGFTHYCKECFAEKKRKYRQANAEKLAEKNRKYRQANAEKIAERERKYRQAYAEKIAEYRQANAEKVNEKKRKYRQARKQEESANLFFQMAHFASEITKTTITP